MGHDHGASGPALLIAVWHLLLPASLLLLTSVYLVLSLRGRAGARAWPLRRTIAFVAGIGLTCWALLGPLHAAAEGAFAAHMAQHLVVGMLGPFLAVLGAPVTLLLRRGPVAWRAPVSRVLHARYTRFVAHPLVALILSVGTLPVLYGTSLYQVTAASPELHALVHAHFFASGYLFAWVICGPDPAPKRPGVPARLVVLGVAVLVHATVSQVLYAGLLPVPADPVDLRFGATLMYYGGDLIELALAVALVTSWRPDRGARSPAIRPRAAGPVVG